MKEKNKLNKFYPRKLNILYGIIIIISYFLKVLLCPRLTLLTYPLLIFQQLFPFNRDKISSFLIRVLKFHYFYLDNTIYKTA